MTKVQTETPRGIQITVPVVLRCGENPPLSVIAFEQDGCLRLAIMFDGSECFWISNAAFETLKNAGTEALATLEDMTCAR